MVEWFSVVVGALAAGAIAKTGDIGGKVVLDAYEGLRNLLVSRLGKAGAVQAVEDDPESETAKAGLVEVLAKSDVGNDHSVSEAAEALKSILVQLKRSGEANIDVGDIIARADILIERLQAEGTISIGNIVSDGSVTVTDLTAKKA